MSATTSRTYLGPWINWSHGVIRGSTLTLTSRDGALLLAFVALFVALAANAVWRIVAFLVHQARSTPADHDGLHYQHQAILRNTESPGTALWQFTQLAYSWRKKANKTLVRSLGMLLVGLVCLAVLGVASVFSARIVSAHGQETLIISDNCGLWSVDPTQDELRGANLKLLHDTLAADAYARECYGPDASSSQCTSFFKSQLPSNSNATAECPFSPEICRQGFSAYEIDTGLLSSFDDLGVNTAPSMRVGWRKKSTCAVLERVGYNKTVTVTAVNATAVNTTATKSTAADPFNDYGSPGDVIDFWNYGVTFADTNCTFFYNRHTVHDLVGYGVTSYLYEPSYPDTDTTWSPIDALRRKDADLSIVFLNANSIDYTTPNKDPMFGADLYNYTLSIAGKDYILWQSNFYTAPLACIDQVQLCNPNNNQCTPFTDHVLDGIPQIGFNIVQAHVAELIIVAMRWSNVYNVINGRGSSALRAQDVVHDLRSEILPDNQWQLEVEAWFMTGLAKIQRNILEFAAGPSNVGGSAYITPPIDDIQKALCYSQMVPSASNTINFSIANLSIVLLVSALLILTNLSLDTIVGFFQSRANPRHPRRLRWILAGTLQLQRMAFEGAGMGEWSGGADNVPVTSTRERFGKIPSDVDVKHPQLRRCKDEAASNEAEMLLGPSHTGRKTTTTVETHALSDA